MWKFFVRRHNIFYKKNRWHLVADILAFLIIVILVATIFVWYSYRPVFDFYYSQPHPELGSLSPLEVNFSLTSKLIKLPSEINLQLNYKNNSNDNLDYFKIEFISNQSDFSLKPGSFQMENLKPGASAELNIPLTLSGPASARQFKWQAQIEIKSAGRIYRETKDLTSVVILPDLRATAKIFYNSPQGDQLGAGPIPPQVSLPTNYWVSLEALGLSPDLKNFVFSAQLADGVNLTERQSLLAGTLKYSSGSRQVIWSIIKTEAEQTAQAGFEIQFIPASFQAAKVADLLKNIKYSATDSLSGEVIGGGQKNLTTNLEFDLINAGSGKIEI